MRVERQTPKVKTRGGESGAILVEAIIGLVIFTVVLLSAAQFLRWNVEPLLMKERQDKAAKQAESVLNELAARRNADLPAGGSFAVTAQGDPTRNTDNSVTLNCTTSYCDQIVATPQAAGTAFDFVRAAFGAAPPANGMQIYVRAWRVETVDAARNLRRITIAVFPAGSGEPLAVRKSEVVQR
jgi:Tfp pilus assembly protein PilV